MAFISKTEAGTYQANWRDPAGKQKAKTFRTRKEAAAFLADTESAVNKGTYIYPGAGKIKFGVIARQWQESHQVSARATERIASVMRAHVLPRWKDWPLAKIEHLEVQSWVNSLSSVMAYGTARKAFDALSMVMQAAVRSKFLGANPCEGIRLTGRLASERLTITREDFLTQLLPAVPAMHQPLIAVAGGTGMRWGELAGLPWSAVNLEKRTVRVQQVAVETSGAVTVRPFPKSQAGRRTIPLPAFAVEQLTALRDQLGHEPSESELVFDTKNGTAFRRSNYRRQVWRPALVRAGLLGQVIVESDRLVIGCWTDEDGKECMEDFETQEKAIAAIAANAANGLRFHDLRHSYATWLVSDGMPVNVVQRIMGHQKASTTLNLYTHAPSDYDERVRRTFEGPAEFPLSPEDQTGDLNESPNEKGGSEQGK